MSFPKILQIVPALSGSLGRATLDAAQAVIADGGAALVASPGGTMLPDLLRLRATHIDVPAERHALLARLRQPARLYNEARELDLNVIHARSPIAAWTARTLARRLKLKWLATLHQPTQAAGSLGTHVERQQAHADALIAVSEHVANDMRRRLPAMTERLQVIPPGVNLDRFDPAVVRPDRVIKLATDVRVPDGAHVVLCPGRFTEDRGQKTLIEAIKMIGRDDVFGLLLGSIGAPTAFEKELERTIEASGLNGRVQIGPYIEDMPAAYLLADVVVATGGARQGFSRPVVEAQAMGRPVVCELGGGAAEAVVDGITGWLAAEGDAASMARAIRSALALSADRRAEFARAAQNNIRIHHGLERANARLLQVYEGLLA